LSAIGPSGVDSWRWPLAFLITLEIVGTRDSVSKFNGVLRFVPTGRNETQIKMVVVLHLIRKRFKIWKKYNNRTNSIALHEDSILDYAFHIHPKSLHKQETMDPRSAIYIYIYIYMGLSSVLYI
jgi:hypothetical protein